jgi:hypothetical protein
LGFRGVASACAALGIFVSRPAAARPERVDRHHEGFFARVAVGRRLAAALGGRPRATSCASQGRHDHRRRATLGLSVERNLVLHLTGHYWQMVKPRFRADDREASGGKAASIVVGPGLSYYFMPVNIYLSGSLGLGFMFMDRPGGVGKPGAPKRNFRSDGGWVLLVSAGKEFWVDPEWAVGISAYFSLSNFPEPANIPVWAGPGLRAAGLGDLRLTTPTAAESPQDLGRSRRSMAGLPR